MTQTLPTLPILHDLQRNLAHAGDAQVERIVAMVDAMPNRGEADALIALLRPRLAHLRPARPLGFTRLLFTPIDPLVVPAVRWRPGALTVPRSALAPIGTAMRAARPALAEQVDTQVALLTTKDAAGLGATGATLWPEAVAALGKLPRPDGWAATGLAEADYAAIIEAIAAVLYVACDIHTLVTSRRPVPDEAVRRVLGRTVPRGAQALSTVIAVLLARLPNPARLVALAAEASGVSPPHATDRAVDHALDRVQDVVENVAGPGNGKTPSLGQAAQDTADIAVLLAGLEPSASTRPDRKRRIEQLRRDADAICRRRFEAALSSELMPRLNSPPPAPAVEALARDVGRLAAAGRMLGDSGYYSAMLLTCLPPLREPAAAPGQARIAQILAAPDDTGPG